MPNMEPGLFHRTAEALADCYDHMGDNDLSDSEKRARTRIIKMCRDIIDEYDQPGNE